MVLYILFSNPISYTLHLLKLSGIGCWDPQNSSFLKISEFFLLALKEIWVSSEDSDSSAAFSSGGCFFPTPCSGIGILFVLFFFSLCPYCCFQTILLPSFPKVSSFDSDVNQTMLPSLPSCGHYHSPTLLPHNLSILIDDASKTLISKIPDRLSSKKFVLHCSSVIPFVSLFHLLSHLDSVVYYYNHSFEYNLGSLSPLSRFIVLFWQNTSLNKI